MKKHQKNRSKNKILLLNEAHRKECGNEIIHEKERNEWTENGMSE